MKQRIGRLLSTLLLTTFSLGITAGVIKGTIIDKQTKEPLTGATVQVTGSATGAVADLNGNYTLTLNNGTYTLEVKYIGYKTFRMNEVKIKTDATLNFELEVDAQTLDAVTVVARKNLEGEKALLQERQKATLAIENMGAKEMNLHCQCRTTDCARTGRPVQHHHPERAAHRFAQSGQQADPARPLSGLYRKEHYGQQSICRRIFRRLFGCTYRHQHQREYRK